MSVKPQLKQYIGKTISPHTVEIEKGQIRRFATAIGEENPIHFNEEAAKKVGLRTIIAPPTFASALIMPDVFLDVFGWDIQAVIHRAEEYEYFKPIYAGDVLHIGYRISDIYEQPGNSGTLVFVVIETRANDSRNNLVFKGRRVIVKLRS
ncbi:MAG: MaoC family dehydratase N-terminal domain-containing protein [Deltaproteobacteria bacterium]|nr:MaoC family dehydratase N-terminal domain-containing protein [Deltaproteobacteria bacterium]